MNENSAETLLRRYREGMKNADSHAQKALQFAQKDESLTAKWNVQSALDQRAVKLLAEVSAPEAVVEELETLGVDDAKPKRLQWSAAWKQPPILAALFAVLLLIGFLIWWGYQHANNFAGREDVETMLSTTAKMTGAELKPVSAAAGDLGDWVFMNGQFDNYSVPPAFANFKAIGARVFQQDDSPVVQIAVEENDMLFFVFHAEDFGVVLKPKDRWRILQENDWVAAIRGDHENGFMIAFRGSVKEMQDFLRKQNQRDVVVLPSEN